MDDDQGHDQVADAERKLRLAMAAEASAERAARENIKKGFYGCAGIIVLLMIIGFLFF